MSENIRTLLGALAQPLTPDELERFTTLLASAARAGEGFVGMWLASRSACLVALVVAGDLSHWAMVGAASEAEAQAIASQMHAQAQAGIDAASSAADVLIAHLKRPH